MAVVVIGGHSRNLGKTSVVAGLIAAFPAMRWTAIKITQLGHGMCSADGQPCACETAEHVMAVNEERGMHPETDSGRFLAAGAARSFWVRTRQGQLFEAMPRIRQEIAGAENTIVESNSILQFLQPDLYCSVIDPAVDDYKATARRFLDRADAIVCRALPDGKTYSVDTLVREKPHFFVEPPTYLHAELVGRRAKDSEGEPDRRRHRFPGIHAPAWSVLLCVVL